MLRPRPPRLLPVLTLLALTLLAGILGCRGPQPAQCAAVLECLYPGGEDREDLVFRDRFAQCAEDPYNEVDGRNPNKEETLQVLGENGDCWAYGADDPYYKACEQSCANFLRDDCARPQKDPATGANYCAAAMADVGLPCEAGLDPMDDLEGCIFLQDLTGVDAGNPAPLPPAGDGGA